jgi:hypothetical protein
MMLAIGTGGSDISGLPDQTHRLKQAAVGESVLAVAEAEERLEDTEWRIRARGRAPMTHAAAQR